MKTEEQILDKRDQLKEAINPNHPLSADSMMNTLAIQALEWVLGERANILGEKEVEKS